MAYDKDEDIMRQPESSSEDEVKSSVAPDKKESSAVAAAPPSKRKREAARPSRPSKRKKLEDRQDLPAGPSNSQQHPPASKHAEFEALSQTSQSKKRPGYGSRHKSKYSEIPMRDSHAKDGSALNTQDIQPRDTTPPKKEPKFNPDEDFVVDDVAPALKPLNTALAGVEPEPASSASTSATRLRIFDDTPEPEEADKNTTPLSSPPTSPAVDDREVKKDPVEGDFEHSTISCPVCHRPVLSNEIPKDEVKPHLLSLKKQREFCTRHRLTEARLLWRERSYPTIDWQVLELVQIPKHIPHLRRVLQRKSKSYYLEHLDANVNKAQGNRRAIRTYMQEGVLDVAKAGYYGPKGTKIMMNHITSELLTDLKKRLNDKLVCAAGVGNYVAAVLVPELTLRLVMDDLGINDEAQARRVMDESTEMGVLLNPDDDHVEPDEDE